jgi:hypothetical protein
MMYAIVPFFFHQYNPTAEVKPRCSAPPSRIPSDPATASLSSDRCGATGLELFSLGAIEEGAELVRVQMVAQLAQRLGFDLADALAGKVERAADFPECVLDTII